ncbi:MAG: tetratricopeptide repeat protein [Bacteroidota bacterium]
MKLYLLLASLLFSFIYSFSQQLNGKIINAQDETGLKQVRLSVSGYTESRSDDFGRFSVELPGKKRGALVKLDLIKDGFAVINRESLSPRVPDSDKEEILIYMCPTSQRNKLALSHYKIQVEQNIQRNYQKEAKVLADKMNYEAIAELTRKKEVAENMADSLAARLAKFDPQKASEELSLAMQLYVKGEIDSALSILDPDKIVSRILARKQANQKDLEALMNAADIALTNFRFEQAQNYYEKAIEADTSNYDNIWSYASFLHNQAQSDKLLVYTRLMFRQAKDDTQKANALNYLGLALRDQNKIREALAAFEGALGMYKQLDVANSLEGKSDIALVLNNIGTTLYLLDRYGEAEARFLEAVTIYEELNEKSPYDYSFDQALLFGNLSLLYTDSERFKEAVATYEKTIQLYKGLIDIKAYRTDFIGSYIAGMLTNQAQALFLNEHVDEAKIASQKALDIYRELAKSNPLRFAPDICQVLSNMGKICCELTLYQESLTALNESLEIGRELAKKNPERYTLGLTKVLSNLADTYEALSRYEEAIALRKEHLEFHKHQDFQNPLMGINSLGDSYYDLASAYKKSLQYDRASKLYAKADSVFTMNEGDEYAEVWREDIQVQLKQLSRIDILGKMLDEQGMRFMKKEQPDSALIYLRKAQDVYEGIPFDSLDAKGHYTASFVYQKISILEGDAVKNYQLLKKAIKHREEAFAKFPEDKEIQKNLADLYFNVSWYALFAQAFDESELAAQKALSLDSEAEAVVSNLTAALLFQGKYKEALKLYKKWQNQDWPDERYVSYRKAFLADLEELEKAGITHPDVAKVRELLQKKE